MLFRAFIIPQREGGKDWEEMTDLRMVPLLHVVTVTGQDWYLLLSWGIGKEKVSLYFTAGKPPHRTLQLQIMFTELI